MDQSLITILEIVGAIFSAVLIFVLGQRWERRRSNLLVRSQMLDPVRDWLRGVEKFIGIMGDTLTSASLGAPGPVTYDFQERRKSAQFMIENTNEMIGILNSKSLRTRGTKHESDELAQLIRSLESQVEKELLPLDGEILDRARRGRLSLGFLNRISTLKSDMESKLQRAYELVARIMTSLT